MNTGCGGHVFTTALTFVVNSERVDVTFAGQDDPERLAKSDALNEDVLQFSHLTYDI